MFGYQSENKKIVPIILVIFLLLGVILFFAGKNSLNRMNKFQPVACTEEAKLCSDGSYVGRTGPNCEFTACPAISLPKGYTLEAYSTEETLETSCVTSSDCETPSEYKILSRCPFTTICLEKKCTVVCPAQINFSWEEAEALIKNCEITKLSQRHNRLVTLYSKDGHRFQSVEPQLDLVIKLADSLEGECGKIQIGTE